jgi:hypothetical protein
MFLLTVREREVAVVLEKAQGRFGTEIGRHNQRKRGAGTTA